MRHAVENTWLLLLGQGCIICGWFVAGQERVLKHVGIWGPRGVLMECLFCGGAACSAEKRFTGRGSELLCLGVWRAHVF